MPRRGRNLLLFLSPCAGLLLAELALRWTAPEEVPRPQAPYQPSLWLLDGQRVSPQAGPLKLVFSPYTMWKNLPDQSTDAWSTDSHGFRVGGPEIHGGERTRLVVLGGSCTFGVGLDNDLQTIPAQLGSVRPGCKSINAGVIGFLSGQDLAYLVTEIADLWPDVVVDYGGWAELFFDWFDTRWEQEPADFNPTFFTGIERTLAAGCGSAREPGWSWERCRRALVANSAILARLCPELGSERGSACPPCSASTANAAGVAAGGATGPEARIEQVLRKYTGNMEKMSRFCASRGIRFLAVLQPELGQKPRRSAIEEERLAAGLGGAPTYRDQFPALYRGFRAAAARRFQELGIDYLDVSELESFSNCAQTLFLDVVHTNAQCNRLVAEAIDAALPREER